MTVIRSDYLLLILPNRLPLPASPGWGGAELGRLGPCSEAVLLGGSIGLVFPWAGSCWSARYCLCKRTSPSQPWLLLESHGHN